MTPSFLPIDESETLNYQGLVWNSINDALIVTDTDWRIQIWNQGAEGIYGWCADEVKGKTVWEVIPVICYLDRLANQPNHEQKKLLEGFAIAELYQNSFWRGEVIQQNRNGQNCFIDASVQLLRNSQGSTIGIVAVNRDITERKQLEGEHQEAIATQQKNSDFFRKIADQGPMMLWMCDQNASYTYFNSRCFEFTNISTSSQLGKHWQYRIHPEDLPHYLATYEPAFTTPQAINIEYRLQRFDGQYRWLLESAVPQFTARGQFTGYIGMALDITEQKQRQESVIHQRDFFQKIIDAIPHLISLKNDQDQYIFTNQAFVKFYNKSATKLIGQTEANLNPIATKSPPGQRTEATPLNLEADNLLGEKNLQKADGSVHSFQIFTQSIPLATKQIESILSKAIPSLAHTPLEQNHYSSLHRLVYPTTQPPRLLVSPSSNYVLEIASDITHRKQAEEVLKKEKIDLENHIQQRTADLKKTNEQLLLEIAERCWTEKALRSSEAELRALFAAMTDVIFILDGGGRYLKIAPTNHKLLHRPAHELIGKTIYEVFERSQADQYLIYLHQAARTQETVNFQYQLEIEQQKIWFAASISAMQPDTFIWIARDITEMKQAEVLLRQTNEELENKVQERTAALKESNDQLVVEIVQHKQAQQKLQQRFNHLQTLYQMTNALNRVDAIEELYEQALKGVQSALNVERAGISLYKSDGTIQFKTWRGISAEYRKNSEKFLAQALYANQLKPIFSEDIEGETNFKFLSPIFQAEGIRAWGLIPLIYRGNLLGSLTFYYNTSHQFSEDEIQLAQTIATHIAFASDRKSAQEALRRSEKRFRALLENSADIITILDATGTHSYISPGIERITGYKSEEILGTKTFDFYHPDDLPTLCEVFHRALENPGVNQQIAEYRVRHRDGSWRYWSAVMTNLLDEPAVKGIVVNCHDITSAKESAQELLNYREQLEELVNARTAELEKINQQLRQEICDRERIEQALFHEKELAQVTLESIGDAVITTDAFGHVELLNLVAEKMTGWTTETAHGLPLSQIFRIVHETTHELVENPVEIALREGRIVQLSHNPLLIAKDGREIAIDHSAAPIRASSGEIVGAVLVFHDVTQERALARRLSWQASHDSLTGLVNRSEFEQHLKRALSEAQTTNDQHILCYLDLDQFKIVNDTCGHFAGDELLRQVSALLQKGIRKTDTLARLGGDEFGVLLRQCSLEGARRIANALRESVQAFRFVWQEKTFTIGVSIGLVVINAESRSLSKILSAADAACYAAKDKGRNRVQVYQADDSDLAQQHSQMQWVTQIAQAFEHHRFRLYYQPIISLDQEWTEKVPHLQEHYEVLLRLEDEAGDLILPMAFIPAAERYNLMQSIDRWVIRTLFASQGKRYQEVWQRCQATGSRCLYGINISGATINDEMFSDFLIEQLDFYQIPPQVLCFEITETVAIANLSKAAEFIRNFKERGCYFALDDFGSGTSSFAYLKNLPVDYLKIDGSFVKNIVDNPLDFAMIEAINRIAHVMGIQTIAESVENDGILNQIRSLGVDYAQGYGIAPPQPLCEGESGFSREC